MSNSIQLKDYPKLVARLSAQSVTKHFEAYRDVAWDDPDFHIDADDPRWELPGWDELGSTSWYRQQPAERRRAIGLWMVATRMKIGWQFENVLQRGLLTFVEALPNRSPEFRYAHHEIIEESQHSLMFQEFVDRSGLDIPVFPLWMRLGNRPVISSASWFPELFFLHVLAGEEPIDFLQRKVLHQQSDLHPLVRRLAEIHVLEEARHVCFARRYLEQRCASAGPLRMTILRTAAPLIFASTSLLMLRPSPDLIRAFAIPSAVMRAAYPRSPRHRQTVIDALAKVRTLCSDLDLLNPRTLPMWQRLGIAPL